MPFTVRINSERGLGNPVFAMASNTPQVAHCPRCLLPLDVRQSYSVQVCLPVHPPHPPGIPNLQAPPPDAAVRSSLLPVPHHHHHNNPIDTPAPPYEPPSDPQPAGRGQGHAAHNERHNLPPPSSSVGSRPAGGGRGHTTRSESDRLPISSPSSNTQPVEGGRNRTARHQSGNSSTSSSPANPQPAGQRRGNVAHRRRSSASSASTVYPEFEFEMTTEFVDEFQVLEEMYLSEEPSQPSSPVPPPMSSPPTETSTLPSSSPPPQTHLALPEVDGSLPSPRRWVVFRGRVPGIYASS